METKEIFQNRDREDTVSFRDKDVEPRAAVAVVGRSSQEEHR
jgi:hypothetical protein